MAVYEPNHDTTSKTLLNGVVLPAGQTAAQDLKGRWTTSLIIRMWGRS